MNRFVASVVLACTCAILAGLPRAPGCGIAPREGDRVAIAGESALIIWDEATKTEHFIRRITFDGNTYDFGFLVPTPTRPQLGESAPQGLADLSRLTAQKTVFEVRDVRETIDLGCAQAAPTPPSPFGKAGPPMSSVSVIEQRRVGDLDAAVLGFRPGMADPRVAAQDLLDWLNKNGYAVRPDLLDWVAVYARDGWVITAFKIAGTPVSMMPQENDPAVAIAKRDEARSGRPVTLNSTTVRMSFRTDRPLYPYREPVGQRATTPNGQRFLQLFVAAKQRMAGQLGDGSTAWPARTPWAGPVSAEMRQSQLTFAGLHDGIAPGEWTVTEFEDVSSPRPGIDEVYFGPSADQSPVSRPPQVLTQIRRVREYPAWFAPVAVAGPFVVFVGGLLLVRLLRK